MKFQYQIEFVIAQKLHSTVERNDNTYRTTVMISFIITLGLQIEHTRREEKKNNKSAHKIRLKYN